MWINLSCQSLFTRTTNRGLKWVERDVGRQGFSSRKGRVPVHRVIQVTNRLLRPVPLLVGEVPPSGTNTPSYPILRLPSIGKGFGSSIWLKRTRGTLLTGGGGVSLPPVDTKRQVRTVFLGTSKSLF